jgi:hypothetical protein
MKPLSALCGCLLLGAVHAQAQVTVEVVLDQEQYLVNEATLVGVRVINFSGQSLKLGKDPAWMELAVEGETGLLVEKLAEPPVVEEFEVPSSSKGTRWLDLQPCFNIGRPGRCQVTASVRLPELGKELTSKPVAVTVTSGARVWQQEFGLPPKSGETAAPPEVRRYALVQGLTGKRVRLYVRVTDSQEIKVYRVFPIGPMLTFSHPETQVDAHAILHVLFQTSARQFTYVQVDPDGQLLARQTHQYAASRPKLNAEPNGTIAVRGGVRIRDRSDIPKPEEAQAPAPAKQTEAAPAKDKPAHAQ